MRRAPLIGIAFVTSCIFAATPSSAAPVPCVQDLIPVFSPGHWVARGIIARGNLSGGGVNAVDFGNAQFRMDVDQSGNVDGEFELIGKGSASVSAAGGSAGGTLDLFERAELTGSPGRVVLTGTLQASGTVKTPAGSFPVDQKFPIEGSFTPLKATCTTAAGDLIPGATDAINAAGFSGSANAIFFAKRIGDPAITADVEAGMDSLATKLQTLARVDGTELNEADVHALALEAAKVNALAGGAANCGDLDPALVNRGIFSGIIADSIELPLRDYLLFAQAGSFTVQDILNMLSGGIRGGILAWDGGCTNDARAQEIMDLADTILVERAAIALEHDDQATLNDLQTASLELGLRKLAAVFQ